MAVVSPGDEAKSLIQLNTGQAIPSFGLGTSLWRPDAGPGELSRAVEVAVRAGYRLLDTAWIYKNEDEIGVALRGLFEEGVVTREEMFITSKLWSAHHAPEDVEPACRESLQKLQLDYLDLYLVHCPIAVVRGAGFPTKDACGDLLGYDSDCMAKTWKAMEQLVEKGLVKAIGISNFSITKTEKLLETATIIPAVDQVECHPHFQQRKLRQYCKQKEIVFEAYAPLGSPGRRDRMKDYPIVINDPVLKQIAENHNATPGQICIAFVLSLGAVAIPMSTNEGRIKENLAATKIKLTPEEMERLRGIDRNTKLFTGAPFLREGETAEDFWDTAKDEAFVL